MPRRFEEARLYLNGQSKPSSKYKRSFKSAQTIPTSRLRSQSSQMISSDLRKRIAPSKLSSDGLGRQTMPEMSEYSAVAAVHIPWLAAQAEGIGMGWVSILDPRTIAAVLEVPPDWKLAKPRGPRQMATSGTGSQVRM